MALGQSEPVAVSPFCLWTFPSRLSCQSCHCCCHRAAGLVGALGVQTSELMEFECVKFLPVLSCPTDASGGQDPNETGMFIWLEYRGCPKTVLSFAQVFSYIPECALELSTSVKSGHLGRPWSDETHWEGFWICKVDDILSRVAQGDRCILWPIFWVAWRQL